MKKEDVIEKLRNDEDYYGAFGKKYLSNSDIGTLLTNPLALGKPTEQRPAFLVGGYFHTAILEPDKLKKYRVIPSSTRNTKAYKDRDWETPGSCTTPLTNINNNASRLISDESGLSSSTSKLSKLALYTNGNLFL